MNIEIDGEFFQIKKRERDGRFTVGYYIKEERTGTLISENTVENVKKELIKASKIIKIYAKSNYVEGVNITKRRKWNYED